MVNFGNKYEDIIKTAKELFWKHGFKRVTIEEICRRANVSKMTYYKHFPDKIELAKTIFDRVVVNAENEFRQIMKEDSSADEKIRKIIQLKVDGTNEISPEFLQDFYTGTEPELRTYVEERTHLSWDILIEDFKEAQRKGIFRKDFNPEFLIKIQYKFFEMLGDKSITGLFNSQQEMIMAFVNLMIYGIRPHD
jgi:AcrR family transcriptional regulator